MSRKEVEELVTGWTLLLAVLILDVGNDKN